MNDLCGNPHCTKYMWEITYMLLHSLYLTIVMIIIKMFVLYYVCCRKKCKDVHCSFYCIYLNLIDEKKQETTLLIFVYLLVNP